MQIWSNDDVMQKAASFSVAQNYFPFVETGQLIGQISAPEVVNSKLQN